MKKLYAIYDRVAQAVGPIVLHAADAPAVRMFGDVASDPQTNVSRHTADFELLCLGDLFDDGRIEAFDRPRVVLTGQAWKDMQSAVEEVSNG